MENEKDMREEVLRRYRSTREKKKKCIEDMKELLEKRYIERTGEKPKYFFSL
ncbi:MAG: protein tyrosine phosphatase [Bacteroidales bacterium]|nr:protein tyrosine phosphatase [Bacteroidales bacterium]MDD6493974.1 protein tyrosine phosphatase [Bacteroidales bacterium]MDY5033749.1 protein tyrosine phosphatase [Prevotella sp.]